MIRRIAVTVALIATAAITVTACGAGTEPQTAKSKGSVQGTSVDHGSVSIRNASVVSDGTDAYVQMTLINQGAQDDTLTGVVTSASPKAMILDGDSKETTVILPKLPSGGGNAVTFNNKGTTIDIVEITSAPAVGSLVTLSLSFKLAGDVTLRVPVLDYKTLTGDASE